MTLTALAPADSNVTDVTAPLRDEVDRLDAEILAIVRRRVELTRRAGRGLSVAGTPKAGHAEMDILRRYERELGRDGVSLAMTLLRLGRTGLPID